MQFWTFLSYFFIIFNSYASEFPIFDCLRLVKWYVVYIWSNWMKFHVLRVKKIENGGNFEPKNTIFGIFPLFLTFFSTNMHRNSQNLIFNSYEMQCTISPKFCLPFFLKISWNINLALVRGNCAGMKGKTKKGELGKKVHRSKKQDILVLNYLNIFCTGIGLLYGISNMKWFYAIQRV